MIHNLVNNYGWSALMSACFFKKEEVVGLLLQRKDIQVNMQNNDGYTVLMLACDEGCARAVTLLLDRDDINTALRDWRGKTAYDLCDGISDAVKARLKERMG
jgi:ankyrin repeat protein